MGAGTGQIVEALILRLKTSKDHKLGDLLVLIKDTIPRKAIIGCVRD